MLPPRIAIELLESIWANDQLVGKEVDVERMEPETLDAHIALRSPYRPLWIRTWLARQGYFISAFSLWEFYSRTLCENLPNQVERTRNETCVTWVARSLAANTAAGESFTGQDWFEAANALRNLIAHHGAMVIGERAEGLLERARKQFSILLTRDACVDITRDHANELQTRVYNFIEDTEQLANSLLP